MKFKKILGFRAKYWLLLLSQKFKKAQYFDATSIDRSKNQIYIFLAADYGNLGDVAITYAQTEFLKNHSDYQVFEIPISKSLEGLWFVKKNIKTGDILTTVGGGNMGDLYDQIEYIRQLVVRFFPINKIISFPQTFDFSETKEGEKSLEVAKRVYNSHNNIYIIAREQTSFNLMKKHYINAKVLMTPDIVLSLNKVDDSIKREGAVLCLRDDSEKLLKKEHILKLKNSIHDKFNAVENYDTHIGRGKLSIEERIYELEKIWGKFKGAELVVTDRLHGMIFCYITNTPCLVFQNNNHKVRETYNWIKDHSNVTLMTEFDEKKINDFIMNGNYGDVAYQDLQVKYKDLISIL